MVQFTQTDFKILLSMTLFLVIISFVFPAVGFTAGNVSASDIPEFNASQGQFGYVNSTPEYPARPSEGTLTYIEGAAQYEDNRQVWLQGDSSDGVSITLVNFAGPSNPNPEVNLNKFNGTGAFTTTKEINENEFVSIENYSYIVTFENLEYSDNNNTITVDWTVEQQPSDTSWLGRLPIIGGVASGADQAAAVLGWIGAVIFQPIYNGMVRITNTFVVLFNILTFFFNFMYWILSTYAVVTSAAPNSWVSVFMAIPGVVLSFEFAKLLILFIQTILRGIPFT